MEVDYGDAAKFFVQRKPCKKCGAPASAKSNVASGLLCEDCYNKWEKEEFEPMIKEVEDVSDCVERRRQYEEAKQEKLKELAELLQNCPHGKLCPLRQFEEEWAEKQVEEK